MQGWIIFVLDILSKLVDQTILIVFSAFLLGIFLCYVTIRRLNLNGNLPKPNVPKGVLINYFLPDEEERRNKITVKRVKDLKGDVSLLAVAATTYFQREKEIEYCSLFLEKLREKKVILKLILLNPYSQAAKFRFARERNDDVDAISTKRPDIEEDKKYENSPLFIDIMQTLKKVKKLIDDGANIQIKLTNFEPTISMMHTSEFVYVDILSFGRDENTSSYKKQDRSLPIQEFGNKSSYHKIAKSHFDWHWKYGISLEDFEQYKKEFIKDFKRFSFTGYRLIKQHESWISIDPVIGCTNECSYCVLQTSYGNNTDPIEVSNLDIIPERLKESKFYHSNSIITLFSYSDALLKKNQNILIRIISDLRKNKIDNWISIATKTAVDSSVINKIHDAAGRSKLMFFVSVSGLNEHESNIDHDGLIRMISFLNKQSIPVVHYWRPITLENCSESNIKNILEKVSGQVTCSVAVGLKASTPLNKIYKSKGLIPHHFKTKNQGDYLPIQFHENLFSVLSKLKIKHLIYFHTSCAVSFVINKPDYTGTMFRKPVCALFDYGISICPDEQKNKCREEKEHIESLFQSGKLGRTFLNACDEIGIDISEDQFCIHNNRIELNIPIYQEEAIYLTHRIGFPIIPKSLIATNQYVGSIVQ
jgi:hypothetical protein